MEKKPVPYQKTVFVCTHSREDKASCGNPGRGGLEICAALKDEIKKKGLKDQVRVARSGCLDRCAQGPNVFVYPQGEWLSGVKPEDVPEILSKLV